MALRMPLAPSLLEPVNLAEGTKDPGKVGSSVGMESLLTLALPSTPCYTPRGCQEGRAKKADASLLRPGVSSVTSLRFCLI